MVFFKKKNVKLAIDKKTINQIKHSKLWDLFLNLKILFQKEM